MSEVLDLSAEFNRKVEALRLQAERERQLVVELCGCLNAAIRLGRAGALPDDTSVEVWAETVKRGMAQVAQESGDGDDGDPAIPAPKRPSGTLDVRLGTVGN